VSEYKTAYLKADSEESFFNECLSAGLVENGEIILSSKNHTISVIGEINKETGDMISDGMGGYYPATEVIEGYHANLRCKNDVGLSNLEIEVNSPTVVFA